MLDQTLPSAIFERLRGVFVEMTTSLTSDAVLLTEAELPHPHAPDMPYSLCISPRFSAYLQGVTQPEGHGYQTRLTCAPNDIFAVLEALQQAFASAPASAPLSAETTPQPVEALLRAYGLHALQDNDQTLQCTFTTRMLQVITESLSSASRGQPVVDAPPFSPHQTEERLVHHVTTQIRQSLELQVILETAVEQVCAFLRADRLVIYQFTDAEVGDQTAVSADADQTTFSHNHGWVTYEARSSPKISSVLHYQEQYCWDRNQGCRAKYAQGQTLAIDDIETSYTASDCLLDFLRTIDVRAKMLTPLIVRSRLWGLLIVHQCFEPRAWQPREQELLRQIGEQLEIAIYQSQLYEQLQQQKQTLEQQVAQRTQQLQTALLETQSANRAKSDFLATMSHELRTPLTCVIGMSATLLRWSLGPLTEKQRSYLQRIHDSGEHLLELINDILDFSHVASGKATLNLSEFSLSSLAQQSLHIHREQAQGRGVELTVNVKVTSERDRFVADARRVKQILFILLDNAIKFTPTGGTVTLRVWVEANTAVFQVEDTGIGISPSQQTQLFQKFQQLDTSYRRAYEGTGLGLAMAKQFVDLHRGWIDVNSVEGQGSIFTVELPHQTMATGAKSEAMTPIGAMTPGERIVLIEPQEESASVMCDMLTAAGYQVIWTVDMSTAVEQIRLLQPDVVITELNLYDPYHQRIIEQVNRIPNSRRAKVVALIDDAEAHDPQTYVTAGVDAYLTKPIDPQHLVHKIDRLLTHASAVAHLASEVTAAQQDA